jgi:hypothetical protein
MKFVHKLFSGEITPWARWVRRWYGEFGIAQAPSTLDTPIWRTFKKVFALYRQLTVVAAGSGVTVSFWLDNWHNAGPCSPASPRCSRTAPSPRSPSLTLCVPPGYSSRSNLD